MSDEATPKVDPKYYQASGAAAQLVPAALKAFRAMLWAGIILAGFGVLVWLLVGWVASLSIFPLAVPLFAGAGIVAGLGKREAGNPS